MVAAALQVVKRARFFGVMPGLTDGLAMAAALGFMLGAFGQIGPINDFMIGKMASGAGARARIYGVRKTICVTSSVSQRSLPHYL